MVIPAFCGWNEDCRSTRVPATSGWYLSGKGPKKECDVGLFRILRTGGIAQFIGKRPASKGDIMLTVHLTAKHGRHNFRYQGQVALLLLLAISHQQRSGHSGWIIIHFKLAIRHMPDVMSHLRWLLGETIECV
jgi:hypothetical protein